jgi:CheY-like chemotaxis protein
MIEQVLMNLAVNARDAMPKGGNLTISLEPVQIYEECIKQNITVHPGRFICLKVSDTGYCIDEATLQHIFEPFFTTKEIGKGTGLGLATAYGIVAQHKGWIEVESQAGNGATFKVFFPAAGSAVIPQLELPVNDLQRGHETILYVEDDESLRRVVAQGLRLLGYRVLEADNGMAALDVWRENGAVIDLLFSDMVMPKKMNGLELAEKLRERNPTLPVIVSSGYNTEMAGQSATSRDDIVFFQKPYDFEALAKSIRHCLDQAASHSNASSPPDGR